MLKSHVLSDTSPLSVSWVREVANSGVFHEISNHPGSVRRHIFNMGLRHKQTGRLQKSIMFAIYQTGRHGPQNGYRICLVHEGFYIESPEKMEGADEDEIDVVEREIPQDHEEFVILGKDGVV